MTDFQQPANFTVQNLRELRKQTGMSRRALIERLGEHGIEMHPNSLRRIEEGHQPMKIHEAQAFAEIFKIGLAEFVTQPVNTSAAHVQVATEELMSTMRALWSDITDFLAATSELNGILNDPTLPPPERSEAVREGREWLANANDEKLFYSAVSLSNAITDTGVTRGFIYRDRPIFQERMNRRNEKSANGEG